QDYRDVLAAWQMTLRVDIQGLGNVLFCHATPRNEDECFTRLTPEDRLLPVFDRLGASVVVCGHTHMQFDRVVGRTRVVNAGSIGMPFGPPGADWLLLGAGVDLRHTNYDRESARRRIAGTGFPNAPEFDMLNPPTAEKMLELYSKAELKA